MSDAEKKAFRLRGNIRMYLNVLHDKINRFLLDPDPLPGDFESEAKQNHDALEALSLVSDLLKFEERKKLRAFVRRYKGSPIMSKEEFPAYKTELEALMGVFPEEQTIWKNHLD